MCPLPTSGVKFCSFAFRLSLSGHTNMSGLETKVNELKLDVAELRALGDRYRVKRTTLMRSNI